MALAVDTTATGRVATASSVTFAHTCNGYNRILIVLCNVFDATPADRAVSGVTYNGTAMTFVNSADLATGEHVELFYLINPSSGANNVVVTMGGTCTLISCASISFTGAKQSGQPDASNQAAQSLVNPASINVSTVADGCYVVGVCQSNILGGLAVGGGQTQIYSTDGGFIIGSYEGPQTPAGAVTHSYSNGSSDNFAIAAISIAPATSAGNFLSFT